MSQYYREISLLITPGAVGSLQEGGVSDIYSFKKRFLTCLKKRKKKKKKTPLGSNRGITISLGTKNVL